ncbi:exported hypothetical protein [Candidatus Accumulibacter aalborgensis]|uniref:PEP-CTERM protein-sorting domain-containing protein n=1 Tax=Candidatus Accumulibacter aalborgensis TaxID=1860102 RepID=A0A1A8XMM1_9PROT|nr:PEP-CTERM sorting domain-containing protein [Candidatus Accumulibacter aalborgensis]SBT05662.1 exported hypothetical protein [Candidatus Accumulibacter aalborgensis]
MKTSLPLGAAAFLCAAALTSASASATTIGFESLADLDPVTTQFSPSGVTFANTIALKAGLSLNDGEFPPHSGSVVISDDGGPMTMLFSTPVTQVGVFFTYALPLTLTAWDVLDHVVGSLPSAFANNTAASGDPGSLPNEWLQLAFASGIAKLTVEGDALGSSFVLDDLSFTPTGLPAPEPGTSVLMAIGLTSLLAGRRFKRL